MMQGAEEAAAGAGAGPGLGASSVVSLPSRAGADAAPRAGAGAPRQLLLYAPSGPIGGTFICSRCGAAALQPDLIGHGRDCIYAAASDCAPPG